MDPTGCMGQYHPSTSKRPGMISRALMRLLGSAFNADLNVVPVVTGLAGAFHDNETHLGSARTVSRSPIHARGAAGGLRG